MPLLRSQGNASVFVAATQPTTWNSGDIWIDTSGSTFIVNVNQSGTATSVVSSAASITIGGISDTLERFILEK